MDNFVVSARKYRPASFATVIGQQHIVQTLKNAIRNKHLAHAFLFCGPRGVGKTTTARLLAKSINCTNLSAETEACNSCESCLAFNKNVNFNIYELDAASNNSVEDIRALTEQVRYAPQGAQYKIYIIDEVHMLSSSAFNAFLKTLEEPPPYAKFILATTEKHKILPTILSRCQVFDFYRIRVDDAVKQLKIVCDKEGVTAEEEALHVIGQKADGAMRDALSIFDRIVSFCGNNITYKEVIANLNILDYDYYFKLVSLLLQEDLPATLTLFDETLSEGFDPVHFLYGLTEHFRNLSVCKYPETVKLLEVTPSVAQKFLQQAEQCEMGFLLNALNFLNKCEVDIRAVKSPRFHIEIYLMKLCHLSSFIKNDSASLEDSAKKKISVSSVSSDNSLDAPIDQSISSKPKQTPPQIISNVEPESPKPNNPAPLKTFQAPIQSSNLSLEEQLIEQARQRILEKANVESNAAETEIQPIEQNFHEISKEDFQQAWDAFIESRNTNANRGTYIQLKESRFEKRGPYNFALIANNNLNKDFLEQERLAMLPFFRSKLNHSGLDWIYEVQANESKGDEYLTNDQKLKKLSQQYPALEELTRTLGLELDY